MLLKLDLGFAHHQCLYMAVCGLHYASTTDSWERCKQTLPLTVWVLPLPSCLVGHTCLGLSARTRQRQLAHTVIASDNYLKQYKWQGYRTTINSFNNHLCNCDRLFCITQIAVINSCVHYICVQYMPVFQCLATQPMKPLRTVRNVYQLVRFWQNVCAF